MPAPWSVCLLNQDGEIVRHRHRKTSPETLRRTMAPDRADMGVAVEGRFTWSWLADLCAQEGMPLVLGHALAMQAIQGGQATHDRRDAHHIAVLLRGGRLPPASVSPAALRATRALRRRRMPLMRKRAARLPHSQHTTRQDHLPASGQTLADTANRVGVAARVADPAGPKRLEGDLAVIGQDDALRRALEVSVLTTATAPHTNPLDWRRTVPGSGERRSRVRLDDSHDLHRVPRGQDCVSAGRLVTCAKASAGNRSGPGGRPIGQADLQWACSDAAVLFVRDHP